MRVNGSLCLADRLLETLALISSASPPGDWVSHHKGDLPVHSMHANLLLIVRLCVWAIPAETTILPSKSGTGP